MTNALIRKLELFSPLDAEDKRLLDALTSSSRRTVEAGKKIMRMGDDSKTIHLVLSGIVCRTKDLESGKRQILGYMIPGDFCNLHAFILDEIAHDLVAMSEAVIVDIKPEQIEELTNRPSLRRALWWSSLVDESVLREWIVNLGSRAAAKRIGHFFCEIVTRHMAVGLYNEDGCDLPFNQSDIANSLGLSPVHTNKTLRKLRSQDLVKLSQTRLTVPDFARLATFSSFDPHYLHLTRASHEVRDRTAVHQRTSDQ